MGRELARNLRIYEGRRLVSNMQAHSSVSIALEAGVAVENCNLDTPILEFIGAKWRNKA